MRLINDGDRRSSNGRTWTHNIHWWNKLLVLWSWLRIRTPNRGLVHHSCIQWDLVMLIVSKVCYQCWSTKIIRAWNLRSCRTSSNSGLLLLHVWLSLLILLLLPVISRIILLDWCWWLGLHEIVLSALVKLLLLLLLELLLLSWSLLSMSLMTLSGLLTDIHLRPSLCYLILSLVLLLVLLLLLLLW